MPNQAVVINEALAKKLNGYLGASDDKPAVTLKYIDAKEGTYLPKVLGGSAAVAGRPVLALNEEHFPIDDTLLKSGFFDLHPNSKTVDPLGYYYRSLGWFRGEASFEDKVTSCEKKLESKQKKLETAIALGYPQLVTYAKESVILAEKELMDAREDLHNDMLCHLDLMINGENLNRYTPALQKGTGNMMRVRYSQGAGYYLDSEFDIKLISALVPHDDPMRPKQVALNQFMDELTRRCVIIEYEAELSKSSDKSKADALFELHEELSTLCNSFFSDYQQLKSDKPALTNRYESFKADFAEAIEKVEALDEHRGYTRAMTHLVLTFALGLGLATAALDYGCQAITGSPLFYGRTASRKSVDDLVHIVESDIGTSLTASPTA